jgi:hypothetical protein
MNPKGRCCVEHKAADASHSARCDVDLPARTHEDDPVTGWIALVPFHFLIGDLEPACRSRWCRGRR